MTARLLLDEMFGGAIAAQLRKRGHDVAVATADPSLRGLADEEILASAVDNGQALATANIKDFVPLDQRYRAAGKTHLGIVLISSKAFPQDRSFVGAVVVALDKLLKEDAIRPNALVFLSR